MSDPQVTVLILIRSDRQFDACGALRAAGFVVADVRPTHVTARAAPGVLAGTLGRVVTRHGRPAWAGPPESPAAWRSWYAAAVFPV